MRGWVTVLEYSQLQFLSARNYFEELIRDMIFMISCFTDEDDQPEPSSTSPFKSGLFSLVMF